MVGLKSRWSLALVVGLLFSSLSFAGTRFSTQKVMMGNPVIMIMTGMQVESDFEKLDLTPLKQHFAIYDVDGDSERMRLKLYPLRVGEVSIPEMKSGRLHVKPTQIRVLENPDVSVEWEALPTSLYKNQLGYWRASVSVSNSAFEMDQLLEENTPNEPFTNYGMPGAVEVDETLFGKQAEFMSAIRYEKLGRYEVMSPAIRVKNTTQKRWLFFAPYQALQVKKLPSYLPEFIPLGEVAVNSAFANWFVVVGDLYHWNWQMRAENVLASNLPNLMGQLETGRTEWLSPSVNKTEGFGEAGLWSQAEVDQPFRINELGWVSLPSLRVTYFDTESGKLVDAFLPAQSVVAVPAWLLWLLTALTWVVGLVVLVMLWRLGRCQWAKWRLIWQVKRAQDAEAVWQAMMQWSQIGLAGQKTNGLQGLKTGQKQAKNHQAWSFLSQKMVFSELSETDWQQLQTSFGQWLQAWEARYGESALASELMTQFNEYFYQNTRQDVSRGSDDMIRQQVLEWALSLPVWKPSCWMTAQLSRSVSLMSLQRS